MKVWSARRVLYRDKSINLKAGLFPSNHLTVLLAALRHKNAASRTAHLVQAFVWSTKSSYRGGHHAEMERLKVALYDFPLNVDWLAIEIVTFET